MNRSDTWSSSVTMRYSSLAVVSVGGPYPALTSSAVPPDASQA